MAEFAFKTRKFKALNFLIHLKMTFRQGGAIVPMGTMEEIACGAGIKTLKTTEKHLKWLEEMGFLTYNRSTGALHMFSLYRRFSSHRTGIRVFKDTNIKEILFTGLAKWLMSRERWKVKAKKHSEKSSGVQPKSSFHVHDGLSLAFLSQQLSYTTTTIARFKRSDHLICQHRYVRSCLTPFELAHLKNEDPQAGRKYRKRGQTVIRQMTDKWYFFDVETVKRRKVA